MKIRTLNELHDALDSDLGWRKKEVLYLRMQTRSVGSAAEKTLIRAGVALLYAHWEGFVKNASLSYLTYVNSQGLTFSQLQSSFVVFGIKGRLNELLVSRKSKANRDIVEFLLTRLNERVVMSLSTAVDTESNLSSEVFENIAQSLEIDTTQYQTKYNLIDQSLLKRRNSIAHGDYLDLKSREWADLADEILLMMNWYKTDIQNAAMLGKFRRPVAA